MIPGGVGVGAHALAEGEMVMEWSVRQADELDAAWLGGNAREEYLR